MANRCDGRIGDQFSARAGASDWADRPENNGENATQEAWLSIESPTLMVADGGELNP
jgi:hypothetical protein